MYKMSMLSDDNYLLDYSKKLFLVVIIAIMYTIVLTESMKIFASSV